MTQRIIKLMSEKMFETVDGKLNIRIRFPANRRRFVRSFKGSRAVCSRALSGSLRSRQTFRATAAAPAGMSTPLSPPPLCSWPSASLSSSTPQAAGAHTHTCGWSDPSGLQRTLIYGPEEPQIWAVQPTAGEKGSCSSRSVHFSSHSALAAQKQKRETSPQWQVKK